MTSQRRFSSGRAPGQERSRAETVEPFELTIEKLVYGGDGLGRHEGKVVFVPYAAPGDRLLVIPVERKKSYVRAEVLKILVPGLDRVEPRCPYFGTCGGCDWQHIGYPRQVEVKTGILRDAFLHKFPGTKDLPISVTASPDAYEYRSRARLQLRDTGPAAKIGFFRARSHSVEDIVNCPLLRPTLNAALASIRALRKAEDASEGALELEIACAEETRTWQATPAVTTASPGNLHRRIGEFRYEVSPDAFFQPNDLLIEELVSAVRGLAEECAGQAALDLFCGAGLFTLPLARIFKQVTAVDSSPSAIRVGERNAGSAAAGNVRFVAAKASEWMEAVASVTSPEFALVVLDPPRTGAGERVMNAIRQWAPAAVVYVSCDPQTLIRDLGFLPPGEYRIDFVHGFDLFAQTYHFETVVRLRRH